MSESKDLSQNPYQTPRTPPPQIGPGTGSHHGYASPFLWVPTSYLAMGLIYSTVGAVANIMFFNMGMDPKQAAFWSSFLIWPYVIKLLWAPAVELYGTKKLFVLSAQALLVVMVACVAL